MRIAHFIQRYPPALGGAESYFRRLGQFHASGGDSVDVWTTDALDLTAFWSPTGRRLHPGTDADGPVRVHRFGLWRMRGRRWLLKPLSLLPHRTWQCLTLPCNPIAPRMWIDAGRTTKKYDAVHASAFPYAFPLVCGLRLARRLGVPFFLTPFLHLSDAKTRNGYLSASLRALLTTADGVFVQTPTELRATLDAGVPAERVVLQGLGVDPHECTGGDRGAAREKWGVRPDEIVVGHLANNSVEKGSVDLLRAAERLWQTGRRFTVVVAGPEMPNFRDFVDRFGPAAGVRRLGPLTDDARRDFFAGIDLFALPSRSDSFGLVLLEAWANGIANVAYRCGGVADVIRDGRDGTLVPCGSVDDLTRCLDQLIGDGELRRRYGEAGRARVGREFRWADKLEKVRRTLIHAAHTAANRKPSFAIRDQATADTTTISAS